MSKTVEALKHRIGQLTEFEIPGFIDNLGDELSKRALSAATVVELFNKHGNFVKEQFYMYNQGSYYKGEFLEILETSPKFDPASLKSIGEKFGRDQLPCPGRGSFTHFLEDLHGVVAVFVKLKLTISCICYLHPPKLPHTSFRNIPKSSQKLVFESVGQPMALNLAASLNLLNLSCFDNSEA